MKSKDNYLFLKSSYEELLDFFKKRPQNKHTAKCIKVLEDGWKVVEERYKDFNFTDYSPVNK